MTDPDILEKPSGNQGFQAFVDLERAQLTVGPALEIRAHGLGFDPPVTLNNNGLNSFCGRSVLRHKMEGSRRNKDPAEGYAETDQPSNNPHTKSHA
jgi:hypothetical protein